MTKKKPEVTDEWVDAVHFACLEWHKIKGWANTIDKETVRTVLQMESLCRTAVKTIGGKK